MASPVSVGDVIAIVETCQKIHDAIDTIRRAPKEYEALVHALASIRGTLECLEKEVPTFASISDGPVELLRCLSKEILSAKSALHEGEDVLLERYARSTSNALQAWKRRIRWSSTRAKFADCLTKVYHHLKCITVLVGARQLNLNTSIRDSIGSLLEDLNKRPPPIGYPGSGGIPEEDHVRFKFGLGDSTQLMIGLCTTIQKLHGYLAVMFSDLPGKDHILSHHYRLYCDTNPHHLKELTVDNWSQFVESGAFIQLAFVVGTWQMSFVNFCPNCDRRNPGEWNRWMRCQCNCLYLGADTGVVDYVPRDGFWTRNAEDVKYWKTSQRSNKEEAKFGPPRPPLSVDSSSSQRQEHTFKSSDMDTVTSQSSDEPYFRCMVMVYDPIVNFVCRNVFCRCILGALSCAPAAPRIEILSTLACPNHARSASKVSPHAGLRTSIDYDQDPYFERFGGYQNFRRIARYLNEYTIALAFVDMNKLCSKEDVEDDEELQNLLSTHRTAVMTYHTEVLDRVECCWNLRMKTSYEKQNPTLASAVQTWIVDLRNVLEPISPDEEEEAHRRPLPPGSPVVPFISMGRLALEYCTSFESMAEAMKELCSFKKYVCAWP